MTPTASPKILVLGCSGLLGPYLNSAGMEFGTVLTSSRTSGSFPVDLEDATQVFRLLKEVKPDWIIHSAGLTNVDECERHPQKAYKSNAGTVQNLVSCVSTGTQLVYISTDQVYSSRHGPHEEPSVLPLNEYGRSKLEGERIALAHTKTLVLRTSFFGKSLSRGRQSLDDFMIEKFIQKESFILFDDVLFSPLHMTTLASLIFSALASGIRGVFNAGSRDGISKAAFGMELARHLGLDASKAIIGASTELRNRAKRPLDLRLNSARLEHQLGIRLPSLSDEINKL